MASQIHNTIAYHFSGNPILKMWAEPILWDIVITWDSVFVCFVLFLFFLTVGRNKPKIILTQSAIFEHTCLSMILVIIKNQTHPLQGWKLSSFEDVPKKCATYLERISKFAFPKYFKQWSHHKGMCSLSNWLLWMKQVSKMWISDMSL